MSRKELTELVRAAVAEEIAQQAKPSETQSQGPQLLTVAEACKELKISRVTFWKWQKQGKLTTRSLGRRVYVERGELMNSTIITHTRKS